MEKLFIGIDPGLHGGLSILNENGNVEFCKPLPLKNGALDIRMLAAYLQHYTRDRASFLVLEKVCGMPNQSSVATFTFGKVVGEIVAVITLLKIPFQEVTPQTWKKAVLSGLAWKVTVDKLVLPKNISDAEKAELKKAHNTKKAKAKKDAKLVACEFIEKRFPGIDLRMGKKNYHDGMAESMCMALYAKMIG